VPGRGSAIFLHDSTGVATNGCVSLARPELLLVLRWLRPGASITIRAVAGV
jgi:L,D-peptidoglycan transpeptidase YkuD (ErfK/YbiS/YcfS/YnhG family)